jgi:acetoin utilization protein AcuB
MRTHVVTVKPDDSLRTAWRKMNEHHVRQLPVVDGAKLVGILTDRDIRLHVVYLEDRLESTDSYNEALEALVEGVMTDEVKVLRPEQTVEDAIHLFISEKFGGAPVVDAAHHLVGIVTYIDLLEEFQRVLHR